MKPAITRRRFLQTSAVGCLGGWTATSLDPRLAFGAEAQRAGGDVLVLVFLRGGLDGLSVLVPVGDGGDYYDRRGAIAVPASRVMPVDARFGLHPALSSLRDAIAAGQLAFIPASGSPDPSRSHFDQQTVIERGTLVGGTATGWLSRHLLSRSGGGPLDALAVGYTMPAVLAGAPSALAMVNLSQLRAQALVSGDLASGGTTLVRLAGDGPLGAAAASTAAAVRALASLRPSSEDSSRRYPRDEFAQRLRDVAAIVRADVGLDAAVLDLGGWDLHAAMGSVDAGPMHDRLSLLGDSLGAFYADVSGARRPVTTIVISEFGRRVTTNGSGGTDHGRGGLVMVLGEGVLGGVHGQWPGLTADVLDNGDVPVATDFRDILAEVLVRRLANPSLDAVFPGYSPNLLGLTRA